MFREQKAKRTLCSWLPYVFLLCCAVGIHFFAVRQALMGNLYAVMETDSMVQYLPFNYFLHNAFLEGQFFWSWNVGLGGDVFAGFSYYFTCSPFFYLALLLHGLGIGSWDMEGLLMWKLAFSVVKQFLAMAFMFCLLAYERKKIYLALIGALIYGGSLFFCRYGVYFDNFTEAMVWLPLTIWGLLRYQREKKVGMLIIGGALTAGTSFYFGFISYVFYGIFILFFLQPQGDAVRAKVLSYLKQLKEYALLFLLSLGVAAVFFLPSILMVFSVDRNGPEVPLPSLTLSFFREMPANLFMGGDVFSFPLACLLVFFCSWRKMHKTAVRKTLLVALMLLFYMVPFFYSFFNGLSYPETRWFYLIIFAVAFASADWIEQGIEHRRFGVLAFVGIVLFMGVVFFDSVVSRYEGMKLWLVIGALLLSGAGLGIAMLAKYVSQPVVRKWGKAALVVSVALFLAVLNLTYHRSLMPASLIDSSQVQGKAEQQVFQRVRSAAGEFCRVDYHAFYNENNPLVYDYYGISQNSSLLQGSLSRWHKQKANVRGDYVGPSRITGLDDRLYLQTIFAVKYKVVAPGETYDHPFYKKVDEINGYQIFENENFLSIDAWYDVGIDSSYYDTCDVAVRDALLLRGAVTEQRVEGMTYAQPKTAAMKVGAPWEEADFQNCAWDGNVLTVYEDAEINMPLEPFAGDSELLLTLSLRSAAGEEFVLDINGSISRKLADDYPYAYDYDVFTFRLEGRTESICIKLPPGEYVVEDFCVYRNLLDDYADQVARLNRYSLEDLSVDGNVIRGNLTNDTSGMLVLSIPYSKGWKAYVNGKRAEIFQANDVLSGLYLTAGTHEIKLSYTTPGFYAGLLITSLSLLGCVALMLVLRNKRQRAHL